MGEWVDISLNAKLFKNVDEQALTSTYGALENCFVTESNGLSRFPGLIEFADFGGDYDMHMGRYNNDMVAVGTDGRTFRVDIDGDFENIDGSPVLGGDRVSFAGSRNGLFMAAGNKIIKYNGERNSILSPDAPDSSFVGHLDGYLLGVEKGSGRFQHSNLNNFPEWDALDTFAVDGNPDDINAMLITPFNEILFSGEESLEQYERLVGGTAPFFRRWSIGDGISEPWTLCHADNAAWGLNARHEFVRLSGQTTQSVSDDIQKEIEYRYSFDNIGSFDKAWAAPCNIKGQKFLIFQSPLAMNGYGNKGFTGVFDIRRGQWFEIYGWNSNDGVPSLWPGVSVFNLWGKTFIGGKGKIYQLSTDVYRNDDQVQRVYLRTAHFDSLGTKRIDGVKLTLKRGVGSYTENPKIMMRANPDNRGFNLLQTRVLGYRGEPEMTIEFGAQGTADTWQFELAMTDNFPFELRRLQVLATRIPR